MKFSSLQNSRSFYYAISAALIAAVLWGFGFIAAKMGLAGYSPFELTFLRLFFSLLLIGVYYAKKLKAELNLTLFKKALWPGIFLALTLLLQTMGLTSLSAAKSGFITTTYVLMVFFLEMFFLKRKPNPLLFIFGFLGLIGSALIANLKDFSLEVPDGLTFLCALFAALHILSVDQFARKHAASSAWALNFAQLLMGLLFLMPLSFFFLNDLRTPALPGLGALIGLGILTLACTVLAFSIGITAQKKLPPTLSSLIFLLESPVALLFGYWCLNEFLTKEELMGAVLILLSSASAIQIAAKKS